MKPFPVIAVFVLLSGCGSIPLPGGWVSQDTKQQQNLDALAAKVIEKIEPPQQVNVCDSIREPGKFARSAEIANYYIAMAGCLGAVDAPPPSALPRVLAELEESRRQIIRGGLDRARIVADSLLGVARLGVDLDIAKKDRESRERISNAENSGNDSPGVTVGGDYIVGDGNSNDNRADETTTTTSTSTTSSNDDNSETTTSSNDDNSETTTTTSTTTSTSTSTTSSNDDNREDNRVDNRVTNNAAPVGDDAEPVITDLHARCHYNAETDAERVACNVQYQNAQRLEVYKKCDSNSWARDGDECADELSDRNTWAKRMGLEWNAERKTYEVITAPAAGNGA